MVATDAYGQGIDMADIRSVIHWEPPVNLEMRPGLVVGVGSLWKKSHGKIMSLPLCCDLCFNLGRTLAYAGLWTI